MHFGSMLRWLTMLALAAGAAWLPAQTFDLDQGREPVVSLDGRWRFHPGDSPQVLESQPKEERAELLWAEPGFDDSAWPLLESGKNWAEQGYPAMSGYAWYRFTVRIPPGEKPASLLLAPIVTSFEVYVDGHRVGAAGEIPPRSTIPSTEFRYHLFPLTESGSSAARTVEVALRVWHSPMWAGYVGGGPHGSGHLAGDPRLLGTEQLHHQMARNLGYVDAYSYSITAGLVGFAILCLFLIRHAEREYLWFALILLAQSADNALTVGHEIFFWPHLPYFDLLDGIFAAVTVVAALCFFSRILAVRAGVLGRACLALAVFSPFPAVFYWPGWFSPPASASIQMACLLPAVLWILFVLVERAVRGNSDARLLLLPTMLDLGYYLADNLAIVLAQARWTRLSPRVLERQLSLPPFTMQTGILFHLVFLLAMVVFLVLRFTRMRRREAWLASELEAARQIQMVLLPDVLDRCPGFEVDCAYEPAEQVGGDFFQQIGDGKGGMSIVVGDVSGKGLPAAMLVSVLVGAIRAQAAHSDDPVAMLHSLNERMMGRSRGGFTTCLAAHITAGGLLSVANAGHLPPYLNGSEMAVPGTLPLGVSSATEYACTTVQLAPGDRLTFVSDGVVEAQAKSNPKPGELFGFDLTRALSVFPAHRIAEAARGFGQNDDITVVTVEFSGLSVAPAAEG